VTQGVALGSISVALWAVPSPSLHQKSCPLLPVVVRASRLHRECGNSRPQMKPQALGRRGYDEDCLPQDGLADLESSLVGGHFAAAADEFGRKQANRANNEPRRTEPPHASWIPAVAGMTRTQT